MGPAAMQPGQPDSRCMRQYRVEVGLSLLYPLWWKNALYAEQGERL